MFEKSLQPKRQKDQQLNNLDELQTMEEGPNMAKTYILKDINQKGYCIH